MGGVRVPKRGIPPSTSLAATKHLKNLIEESIGGLLISSSAQGPRGHEERTARLGQLLLHQLTRYPFPYPYHPGRLRPSYPPHWR